MPKRKNEIVTNIKELEKQLPKKRRLILPKIMSVLIAFILWFYVMAVESPVNEKTFRSIPITIEQTDSELSLYSGYNTTVDVTVSGKKSELNQISDSDFKASANLRDYREPGRYSVPITVDVPDNVTLAETSISNLTVYLDVRATSKMPVSVELTDYVLEEGLELPANNDIEFNVPEVTLTGPQSVIDTVDQARVTIALGHVSSSVRASGQVKLFDKSGAEITNPYLTIDTNNVEVKIPVYMTKDVPLGVEFKNGYLNSENSKVNVSPSSLSLRGTVETISEMDVFSVSTIDEKLLTSNRLTVPIRLPDGVVSLDDIVNAEISISHIGTTTRVVTVTDNINVINPESLDYHIYSNSFNITLRGPNELISSVNSGDVTLSIDLSHQKSGAGNVKMPVSVSLSSRYTGKVYEVGEYDILVAIN